MEKIGTTIRREQTELVATHSREASEIQLPAHVVRFLSLLQTHFPVSRDAREWDKEDTRAYGRHVVWLNEAQARVLFDTLRDRYTFRPSPADVAAVIRELRDAADEDALTGADRQIRAVVKPPLAIPSSGNGPARRSAIERLRSMPGWRPRYSAPNNSSTAPNTGAEQGI